MIVFFAVFIYLTSIVMKRNNMKFTVHKKDLNATLTKIQGISSSKKSNLAITACIIIKAAADTITIKATDLETGFEGIFPAIVEIEGEVALNSKKLFEIIREFPEESICLHESESRWVKIFGGKTEFNIMGMNPDDFPQLPDTSDASFFEVNASGLKKTFEKTTIIPPGGQDDRRPYVHGVFFEHVETENGSTIRMVSTDAKRLFLSDYITERTLPGWESVIIPKKGLSEAIKLLEDEETINIAVHRNYFIIRKPEECLTISLLDGDFPEYNDLIHPDPESALEIEIQPLLMTLRRMSILTTDSYRTVVFDFKNNILTISASNPEMGESMESLQIQFEKTPVEVAFNPRFFIDALHCIDDEKALIFIKDNENPCIVEGVSAKDFRAVIMPVQI